MSDALNDLAEKLSAPFDPSEVKWKPQAVNGNRALAIAYADARVVMDRLDDVVGPMNWADDYEVLPDNSVVCRLKVRHPEKACRFVTKTDVGSPSEQPDGGDRLKAAFSDALKRAAVKFGVGRYLYRLPQQWADYDPAKKQFVQTPKLPAWAIPTGKAPARQEAPNKDKRPADQPPKTDRPAPTDVKNGEELLARLTRKDAELAAEGRIAPGALLNHVELMGEKAGYGRNIKAWTKDAVPLAVAETQAFLSGLSPAKDGPLSQVRRQELLKEMLDRGHYWTDPKTKKRCGEIIGRVIPAAAPIQSLTEVEANGILYALQTPKHKA